MAAELSVQTDSFETSVAGSAVGALLDGAASLQQNSSNTVVVVNRYSTTSGSRYLGLDNADAAIKANDSITLTFTDPVEGVGLYLITEEPIRAGDFQLTTNAGVVTNDIAEQVLSDGSAYYLGVLAQAGDSEITQAVLTSIDNRFDFNYAIDDISVASDTPTSGSGGTTGGSGSSGGGRGGSGSFGWPLVLGLLFIRFYRGRKCLTLKNH